MIYLDSMLTRKLSDLSFDLPRNQKRGWFPGKSTQVTISLGNNNSLEIILLTGNKYLDREKNSETHPCTNGNLLCSESGTTNHYMFRWCWENWLSHWEKIFKQNFKTTMSISLYQLDSSLRKTEKDVHWSIVYAAGELEVMWVAITDKVNRLEAMDYTYHIRIRTHLQNIVLNDKRQNAILLMWTKNTST